MAIQEDLPVKPQGGKPPADRLLAVVRQEAIQKMQRVPDDKINVWPHLIAAEFVSLLLMSVLLFLISGGGFADATFRVLANPNLTPNPSSRPQDRKLAIVLFTLFIFYWATLVILGSFFRGPGFNFVFPWKDGLFF